MNDYFVDSIKNLDVEPFLETNATDTDPSCNIGEIISAYRDHASIKKMTEYVIITGTFPFQK